MKDLSYGINGYYSEGVEYSLDDLISFGGFFKKNSEENVFRGQLVDKVGPSVIVGKFLDNSLIFRQIYLYSKIIVKYKFEFDEKKKLWEGKCFFSEGFSGRAFCKVYKSFTFPVSEEERLKRIYDKILKIKKD